MKPMLACDWDESKVQFPLIAQPKIDGVRALNMHGGLTGRSLKLFKNRHATSFFSQEFFRGFDGEMASTIQVHPDLCRLTTSAIGTIEGAPELTWWLFDFITERTMQMGYADRYSLLLDYVKLLNSSEMYQPYASHLRVVPSTLVSSMAELEAIKAQHLDAGYEGTILRAPGGKHKQGRSTVREGGLLRIKDFVESEAIVRDIVEGESNQNEAQINELGLQFRSSHQANMVPNGLVGSLTCEALQECRDGIRVVIQKGQMITVSPGNMDHADRRKYFEKPYLLRGQTIKFKFFPKGVKDKPRFPTFVCIRDKADM